MTQKTWVLAGSAALIAVALAGVGLAVSRRPHTASAADAPANTAKVLRGPLSSMLTEDGTITYRARPDGSPYPVINQARGTYTALPSDGDRVPCGGVLYRVDDQPTLLLCGGVPAYREVHAGDAGTDVRQLNENLRRLGYDAGAAIDPDDTTFTIRTETALEALQHDKGMASTGVLALGDAVFLPDAVRIAKVTAEFGGSAQPGAPVAQATSDRPEVLVHLDPSQQGDVKAGDQARIVLPGNTTVTGKVDRLGNVATVPSGQDKGAAVATIPVFVTLDDPAAAAGFDMAAVQVEITTTGVENALSVPVAALVGRAGGGFAVEVVRSGGRRDLVPVEVGLFDTSGGRVQVNGDVREGDDVVVPSL